MTEEIQSRGRGRPAKFDREELVQTVMNKFWEEGYKNVSLNEIANDTGLTRASLYHSFGSKDTLFLLTLDEYAKISPDRILYDMPDEMTVGEAFFQMFDDACKVLATDKKHRGCYYTNCVNELLSTDLPVKDTLSKMASQQKKLIARLLKKAVTKGELPKNSDVKILTNLIISFIHGLGTFSKTGAREKEMKTMCESFLTQIGFSR